LFLSMPAYVIWGLSTPVLWNTGRKYYESVLQLPILAMGALGFYLFADRGIQAAATVAALVLVLRALVVGATAFRALRLSWMELLPNVGRGMVLCALCAIGVKAGQAAVSDYEMPLLSLVASTLMAVCTLALLVFARPQMLGVESATMVIRFFPGLASLLSRAGPSMQQGPIIDSASEQRL
ncbi:MAG: polysaccharide biosynthesis protein, partial [Polaromonas sp.]|nr:polysaccharide biosynthesis protein [Polaromonas sp.]